MGFCMNCGQQLPDGAKFCADCGTAIGTVKPEGTQRKNIYDGELHKCPNCGEVLNSFTANCPSCGYEIRNSAVSTSVKEFASKLEKVDSTERKIDLIRNYPIPNTKEDVYEFMVFASTNVRGESNKQVFNAWVAKFEQCHKKAELLFMDSADIEAIRQIYDSTKKVLVRENAAHEVKSTGNAIIRFFSNMENPIFGIAVVIVIVVNIFAMITGTFESDGTSVFLSLLILFVVYKVTSKKKSDRSKE